MTPERVKEMRLQAAAYISSKLNTLCLDELEDLDTTAINDGLERAVEAGESGDETAYREALRRWCVTSVEAIGAARRSAA